MIPKYGRSGNCHWEVWKVRRGEVIRHFIIFFLLLRRPISLPSGMGFIIRECLPHARN
jgi:hypothetical protein